MLPFVMSQAVALSQLKQGQGKPADSQPAIAGGQSGNRKTLLARAFDALVVSRMRKARFELQAHRRMGEDWTNT